MHTVGAWSLSGIEEASGVAGTVCLLTKVGLPGCLIVMYLAKLFVLCFVVLHESYFDSKKLKEVVEVMRVSSQPGSRGVSFSPSYDSSCCLSYFLRTFIVNLSINRFVSLALYFLKGVLEFGFVCVCVCVCVIYSVFFPVRNWVRSGPLRSRPKAGLNMCGPY